ncbi:MAG: polyphosphate polymerase domain-containing protein [bacterium]|nr:polyphosphate polymerase domain-containing protein [bacterium]
MAGTTSQRVERKYLLSEDQLQDGIEQAGAILPIYRYAGVRDWYSLRTTYLDTDDLQVFQEYLRDCPVRRKIRIRQYVVHGQIDGHSWVELKEKRRNLHLKQRFRCSARAVALLLRGEDIQNDLRAWNTNNVRPVYHLIRSMILDQRLTPVVHVDYERIAFQYEQNLSMRITLDRNVRFRASNNGDQPRKLSGLVLELKHTDARPECMRALPRLLGASRRRRFSKFGRAMRELDPSPESDGAS